MKAIGQCQTCLNEGVSAGIIPQKGHYPGDLVEGVSAEINDSFLAYFTCSKGHKSIGFLNKHRFEILLESGLLAYLSGFPGEAVLSFAASLERLYELFIRVVLHKRGISLENVDTTWKQLAKQS